MPNTEDYAEVVVALQIQLEDTMRQCMDKDSEIRNMTELLNQAMMHLSSVSGSRNSFTQEAEERLFGTKYSFSLRTDEVNAMHMAASEFLNNHDRSFK